MSSELNLEQFNLSSEQAQIYGMLLDRGDVRASTLSRLSGIKPGMTYKTLEQLIERGLVERHDVDGQVARFRPLHPGQLMHEIETAEARLSERKAALSGVLGNLVSQYNLLAGKPNVRFVEGLDGIVGLAMESLRSSDEIRLLTDASKVREHYPEINETYMGTLVQKKIPARVLFEPGVQPLLNYVSDQVQYRNLSSVLNVATIVLMYDDVTTFVTLEPDRQIGVQIEDPAIAATMKAVFDGLWETMSQPTG